MLQASQLLYDHFPLLVAAQGLRAQHSHMLGTAGETCECASPCATVTCEGSENDSTKNEDQLHFARISWVPGFKKNSVLAFAYLVFPHTQASSITASIL